MSMSPQIGWSVLVNIGPNLLQEGLVGAFRAAQQWDPDAANAFRAVRADLGIEVAVDEAAAPLAGRVHSWLLGQRRPVGTRDVADGVGVPIGSAHRALRAVAQRVGMANGLHVLWEARP